MFDPFGKRIPGCISAERLGACGYEPVEPLPGTSVYASGVLGLEMRVEDGNLRIHDPEKGEDLRSLREAEQRIADEAAARKAAEERATHAKQRTADEAAARERAEQRAAEEAAARKAAEAEVAALRRALRDAQT